MKDLEKGRDQSYARKVNNSLVIQQLRNGDSSATNLAGTLNLSHSAMSSIVKCLEKGGMISPSHSASDIGKGRKRLYFTLNRNYGHFVIVSLSNNMCRITLSNLKEEILVQEENEIGRYDVAAIYEIILSVKRILSREEYRDIPLRNIVIAVPGKVNSNTGELQLSKHFDPDLFQENNKIINLFRTHFDVPVIMQNDINLAIIGEMNHGVLSDCENALLAYVDNGIGAAMIFNREFYVGSSGYAGELGLMRTYFHGKENYLDEFVSLRSIKDYVSETYGRKVKVAELSKMFSDDESLRSYILETATLLGKKLRDIVELLNISKIVLQGRITCFGDLYLDAVRREVNRSQNSCEVEFSHLDGNSIFYGAVSMAIDRLIDEMMEDKISV